MTSLSYISLVLLANILVFGVIYAADVWRQRKAEAVRRYNNNEVG